MQIYDVELDDGNGGITTQQVTITLNGKADNDGPIIVPGNSDVDGAVTERADLDPNENIAPPLTDTGNIAFTEVNLGDTHVVNVAPNRTRIPRRADCCAQPGLHRHRYR